MTTPAQKKANASYRAKLSERGLVRLEVIVPEKDREMMRALAERLTLAANNDQRLDDADVETAPLSGRSIWEALNRAPADLDDIDRQSFKPRTVDL